MTAQEIIDHDLKYFPNIIAISAHTDRIYYGSSHEPRIIISVDTDMSTIYNYYILDNKVGLMSRSREDFFKHPVVVDCMVKCRLRDNSQQESPELTSLYNI